MDTGFLTVVWCLCLGLGFAVAPPVLARVLGVCVWVRVFVSPHHSWLAFGVCAVGVWFCLAAWHSWLGLWVVCICVCAPHVPRGFWLGCAVWVCVLGFRFRLRAAILGCGFGLCVLLCDLCLDPANPGPGVRCGWVCLGSG